MKQNSKSKTITLIGNVGAGKTSALPLVQKTLDAQVIQADELFQTKNPFRKNYLEDLKRWSFTNELWMTLERSELLSDQISKAKKDWVIVDSGLLMSWVYTYSHLMVGEMNQDEWDLYSRLFDKFSETVKIDVVISFRYSIPTLMERIKKRGRDYELEFYSEDYLMQLDKGLNALEEKLKEAGVRVVKILENEIADYVNDDKGKKALSNSILRI